MLCFSNSCSTAAVASSGLGSSWAEQVGMRTRKVAANRRKQASLTLHHSKVVMLHPLEFSEIDTARAYVVPGQLVKHRLTHNRMVLNVNAFYEKVIKLKADVAAFLKLIAFHLHNPPVVTWGA